VIVIDLNCTSVDVLHLIVELKSTAEIAGINVVGFVSHVQGELKQKAQEAGCNMVLARSAFSQNMQQIFKRYAG
jgi:CheY-like chemotaxis protein